jgi:hypothetical protein
MHKRKLGNTNLEAIGLGCMGLSFGYGPRMSQPLPSRSPPAISATSSALSLK